MHRRYIIKNIVVNEPSAFISSVSNVDWLTNVFAKLSFQLSSFFTITFVIQKDFIKNVN